MAEQRSEAVRAAIADGATVAGGLGRWVASATGRIHGVVAGGRLRRVGTGVPSHRRETGTGHLARRQGACGDGEFAASGVRRHQRVGEQVRECEFRGAEQGGVSSEVGRAQLYGISLG